MGLSKIKNPFFDKFKELGLSFKTLLIAPLLIFSALGVVYLSENFNRNSETIEKLKLENATEINNSSGLHKIQGKPNILESLEAPNGIGNVLYYSDVVEKYSRVEEEEEEKTTKTTNKEDNTVTTENPTFVNKWVEVSNTDDKWASFKLGNITIIPNSASKKLKYITEEYWLDENGNYMRFETDDSVTPILGDQRMLVTYLKEDTDLIIIGEINKDSENNKFIQTGNPFIITTKTDSELISDMKSTETVKYWFVKSLALIMLVIGFKGLIAPFLAITNFIPLAGKFVNHIATIIAIILAVIVITIVSLVIKFWWILFICTVIAIYMIYIQGSKQLTLKKENDK